VSGRRSGMAAAAHSPRAERASRRPSGRSSRGLPSSGMPRASPPHPRWRLRHPTLRAHGSLRRGLEGRMWRWPPALQSGNVTPFVTSLPPWRQPRGRWMFSFVNSHTHATRIGWHLWEIDLRFAPGLPPGRICTAARWIPGSASLGLNDFSQVYMLGFLHIFRVGKSPGVGGKAGGGGGG